MVLTRYKGKSTVGLRDICYAMIDEKPDGTYEYGEVKYVAGAIDATITPNSELVEQYADDGTYESYAALGDINISMELAGLPFPVQVDWLGFRIDGNGVLIRDKDAQGGYFAFGFRSMMANNKFRCTWVYRCKASIPEEKAHTKEGNSITNTTKAVSLTASARTDGKWQAVLDENEEGTNAAVVATFFDEVYEETPVGP